MHLEVEKMSDEFTKYHIKGLPFAATLHHFTGPDKGLPHDHPWGFTSIILKGGYVERVFELSNGSWYTSDIFRGVGSVFTLKAEHIHQLIELPEGECWTLVLPQPWERHGGFWDFSSPTPVFIPFG